MRAKRCTKCKVNKPPHEYTMFRGRLRPWCKECMNLASRRYRNANRERLREADRVRSRTRVRLDYLQQSKDKYPERHRARNATQSAIRSGKLKRRPCESCGRTDIVHAHHDDYSKPLQVRWLCPIHHAQAHGKRIDT